MAVVVGFAGFSGSGKTTLLEQIIKRLKTEGMKVGVIKHTHHQMEPGQKDTGKFFRAGADEVVAAGKDAMLKISRQMEEKSLFQIIQEMAACDIILVEGYKAAKIPKIMVLKKEGIEEGFDLLHDENAMAVVIDEKKITETLKRHFAAVDVKKSDERCGTGLRLEIKGRSIPVFLFSDVEGITGFIKEFLYKN
ncbi:molybdopterin-guanine dinucleotide biosynthesis protein B [Thermoanaerobacterium sp. DL9XJH110]|uniref:molybdopterin-guanine dinucleotide biosynthesis protein B n=1 Tax=Thermoanaerobacterium sp. DL9XJH110 TaxID=3386643 RepID=UPI003BB6D0A6